MGIVYHRDLIQGSADWINARKGILTASEMHKLVTPKLAVASNEKQRAHVYEIAAQRISGHVEPHYESFAMLRGHEDEIDARDLYREKYAPVEDVGFITNDSFGCILGYSPDGLVPGDGAIEAKSRDQRFQVEVISQHAVPAEHVIQLQSGILVAGLKFIHYLSFSAGLPMAVLEVEPVAEYQEAITAAALDFENRVLEVIEAYEFNVKTFGYAPTERRIDAEILL